MEPQVLRISEAELAKNVSAIMQRVQTGAEVVIERNAHPVAVIRPAEPVRRKISECIALAKAHEQETGRAPTLDPDFAADVEEIIRNRQPWNPPTWD
jgi:antitoxin (DNA-binding transcriptional repressor) of toxin-antitoxin stability system